jgi:hypothetical protein
MRTRIGICLALALLPALHVAAQQATPNVRDSATAMVVAWWEPGDVRSYAVERVKTGPRAARSRYTLEIHVLEGTEETYTLECRYSAVEVDADNAGEGRAREIFHHLVTATDGLRVRVLTDENGVPLELLDDAALDTHGQMVLDRILALATDVRERERMEAAFRPVLDAAELAQHALDDLGYLLFPFGVAYRLGFREEAPDQVGNPLGGPPLPTTQTFIMTALDTVATTATMRMEQVLDTARVREELAEIVREMGGTYLTGSEHARLRAALLGLRIQEEMDMDVDLAGAWITRARVVRRSVLQEGEETDTRTYTMRQRPAAAE